MRYVTTGNSHKLGVLSDSGDVAPGREFEAIGRSADNLAPSHHGLTSVFTKGLHSL